MVVSDEMAAKALKTEMFIRTPYVGGIYKWR